MNGRMDSVTSPEESNRILVRWNLPGLAAALKAHLESLKRAGELLDEFGATVEFMEPLGLPAEDDNWVIQVAWGSNCLDCSRVFKHYMVWDHIWEQAGLQPPDDCCRECLALRLKRPLGPADWLPCLLNYEQRLIRHPRSIFQRRRRRIARWINRRRPLERTMAYTSCDATERLHHKIRRDPHLRRL